MQDPPSEIQLKSGLLGSLGIYVSETPLRHLVGETGIVSVNLTLFLERGVARWSKGSVSFERKITLGD